MKTFLAAADLLCVPSRSEPQGIVILEALASGVPAAALQGAVIIGILHVPVQVFQQLLPSRLCSNSVRTRAARAIGPMALGLAVTC